MHEKVFMNKMTGTNKTKGYIWWEQLTRRWWFFGTQRDGSFVLVKEYLSVIVKQGDHMPRSARKKSSSGIYHIVLRGINKQRIFEDDEDSLYFLEKLKIYKDISGYEIYAYCLMSNHVHLLMKEGEEPLSTAFRRIGAS
jgi:hypothetical protein